MTNQGISEAVFGGNQVINPDPRPHLPNNFHTFSLGREWDGKVVGFEVFVNDLSAGLGNMSGGIRVEVLDHLSGKGGAISDPVVRWRGRGEAHEAGHGSIPFKAWGPPHGRWRARGFSAEADPC